MTRTQDPNSADSGKTTTEPTQGQHTIGEGTVQEKSGGASRSGDVDAHGGTTPGKAEGNEADIDQALEQQGDSSKPKPR